MPEAAIPEVSGHPTCVRPRSTRHTRCGPPPHLVRVPDTPPPGGVGMRSGTRRRNPGCVGEARPRAHGGNRTITLVWWAVGSWS